MNSGPDRSGSVDPDKVINFVLSAHAEEPIKLVVFAGGEPTLLKNKLLRMIHAFNEVGICTRLVTNGSWAIDKTRADRWVKRLRMAGLREVNFSADDYHLPFIHFDNIVRAWKAAKGQGFLSCSIALCSGNDSLITPDFVDAQLGEKLERRFDSDGIGRGLPEPAEDGTIYMLSNAVVQLLARGRAELEREAQEFHGDVTLAQGPCPFALQSAAISPGNHLLTCCGFEAQGNSVLDLGPIDSEETAAKKLRRAGDDVLVNALHHFGPHFLREAAKRLDPGLQFDEDCVAMCEICEDLVNRKEVVETLRTHSGLLADVLLQKLTNQEQQTAAE